MEKNGQIFMLGEITRAVKSGKKRLNQLDMDTMLNITQRLKMGVKLSIQQDERLLSIYERCTDAARLKWGNSVRVR